MSHLSVWQVASRTNNESGFPYSEINLKSSCNNYFSNQQDFYIDFMISGVPIRTELAVIDFNKPIYLLSSFASDRKYKWYKKSDPAMNIELVTTIGASVQTVTFPSSWCPQVAPKDFTIKLETNCPDSPDRKILPQCTVFAWEEGFGAMTFIGQMTNGELKTNTSNFDASKKYALITFYQDKIVALTGTLAGFDLGYRTFDGSDVDLSRELTSTECTYLKTK